MDKKEKETLLEITRQNGEIELNISSDEADRARICLVLCTLLLKDRKLMKTMEKAAVTVASQDKKAAGEMLEEIKEED